MYLKESAKTLRLVGLTVFILLGIIIAMNISILLRTIFSLILISGAINMAISYHVFKEKL